MKLTKIQIKNNERIDAWVKGIPFQEYSKAKPSMPNLACEEVLRDYTPESPEHTAQYFTSHDSAEFMSGYVTGGDILDPCAGIGSLLAPVYNIGFSLYAWEMDKRAFDVGGKLFPDASWELGNAFEIIEKLKVYDWFDFIIMNPPFNIKWGLYEAEKWSISGAKKSEHLFMELAIRAVKPGGIILAILPSTFITGMPNKFKNWLYERANIDSSWLLKSDFKFTKVATHLFYIRKEE